MKSLENWSWSYDGWVILAGILCAISAALPGCFLVLRRMSMLGDAISHTVLPGLATAFLLTGTRSSFPMFLGAVAAGLLTAAFTEWIRSFGEVDEGASMGVVFTTLFAVGLVLIVQAADRVDLDPSCVLYGAIELTPLDSLNIAGIAVPRVIPVLLIVCLINAGCAIMFFKELSVCAFDPALATSLGFDTRRMHYLLMTQVAVTAVACFESVGNILVVAMLVVPPSTALLLTTRLSRVLLLSALIAGMSAAAGHVSAIVVPAWFGQRSTSTSGMMALCSGLFFLLASLFSPGQGIVIRLIRRQRLALRILSEDVLGLMYRLEERAPGHVSLLSELTGTLLSGHRITALMIRRLIRQGKVSTAGAGFRLSESGKREATQLVRSHRLWEQYLVSAGGVAAGQTHPQAEKLEHFTGNALTNRLNESMSRPATDPHGQPIPAPELHSN